MKMKDYAEFLDQQQREADTELLIQYKKELKDLEEHKGLAKFMSKSEIIIAKRQLIEHITDLESYLNS